MSRHSPARHTCLSARPCAGVTPEHQARGRRLPRLLPAALLGALLSGCGGGDGPALDAVPQSIDFPPAPAPALALGAQLTLAASASSGLPISYSSLTPDVCSVTAAAGVVSALKSGDCIVAATQDGNAHYAPAATARQTLPVRTDRLQHLTFSAAPGLTLYGAATVRATASSGLAASYASTTPQVCQVDAASGLVTSLASGRCVIVASQSGDAGHDAATPVSLGLDIAAGTGSTGLPGVPEGVSATLGSNDSTVVVSYSGLGTSGGSPISAYSVSSVPAGLSASAASGPVTLSCPGSCAGYAFSLSARNASGSGPASAAVPVITSFNVRATFREPDTQPNDSIFIGSFTLDSTARSVTGLSGTLSESMTGSADGRTPMTLIGLTHQLASVSNGAGGLLVSTFALDTIDTFNPGGFADTLNGIYHGYPAAWNAATANSFVTLDLDPEQPTRSLDQTGARRLSYGDCALGGMMGAACMTGSANGGTMGGYPVEQIVSRRPQ